MYNVPYFSAHRGTCLLRACDFYTSLTERAHHTSSPGVYLGFGLCMLFIGGVFVVMWKSSYYGIRVANTEAIRINTLTAENTAFGSQSP